MPPALDITVNIPDKFERIAKVIARAGVCSRREAEKLVAEGRVAVDGEIITSPALNISPGQRVTIDGSPLPRRDRVRLWRYHKPVGLITTHNDEKNRPTVFANLPPQLPRVISVGRLDINSEGLLLLTNDGELARHLELPSTGLQRSYRVRIRGRITERQIAKLAAGMTVDGINYGAVKVAVEREQGANSWLTVRLSEGKNREIRKLLAHFSLPVNRLIRTSYGPFQLDDLKSEMVAEVPEKIMRQLLYDE